MVNPWKIVELSFPERPKASESLFSIGNGTMGQRANFEEQFSGDTLQGSYIGGVYYPDKTRVGWWKNGYPEYFAKVLNSAFWIGVDVRINGVVLDLAELNIKEFYRELDMKRGVLLRRFTVEIEGVGHIAVEAERFISMSRRQLGALRYTITALDKNVPAEICSYVDADVRNQDANYDEKFWELVSLEPRCVTMITKKSNFSVSWAQQTYISGRRAENVSSGERVAEKYTVQIPKGESITLYKYVAVTSSLNYSPGVLSAEAQDIAQDCLAIGYERLLEEHVESWAKQWSYCDIEIKGDDRSQQGIRYCIFMLLQTYNGSDSRLNIGPKGFTGEKYGGSTYWDTEAYCLPFYTFAKGRSVARQLLLYRYNQLDKAIENAEKLGFKNGAALYPMVTMTGEECHNEWEITFEEIHRNGSIAYAIHRYVEQSGDESYLAEYGLEVLISIARFWEQRVNFSEHLNQYVILGVTGPNEYENNVNNNWYTNYFACWCMIYAEEAANQVKMRFSTYYDAMCKRRKFNLEEESKRWSEIYENMYFPMNKGKGVFLQQDGYLDKEQIMASDLPASERPINQHWSWDRILRSCFIKQADVLQGMYYFAEDFTAKQHQKNFDFYEPRTVHESSLSSCVHSILAARLGNMDKAMELFLRTSRLDLDDYNNEVEEGLHITSMAGSWLALMEGFAGMKVKNNKLTFTPRLPKEWNSIKFTVLFQGKVVKKEIK